MKGIHLIIILTILVIISTIAFCFTLNKPKSNKKISILQIVFLLIFIISAGIDLWFVSATKAHGLYTYNENLTNIWSYMKKTPKESSLPKNLNNTVIIYYRFDCPDCHAVYDRLIEDTKNANSPVYFISTRSNQGKELRKSYPTMSVPSVLYIKEPITDKQPNGNWQNYPLTNENSEYQPEILQKILEQAENQSKEETKNE